MNQKSELGGWREMTEWLDGTTEGAKEKISLHQW